MIHMKLIDTQGDSAYRDENYEKDSSEYEP